MIIADIVNRDIVNLENCESEPIHIPGSIQPHGFLLGVELNSMQIVFCSGNISEFIATTHDKALGKPLQAVIPDSLAASLLMMHDNHSRADNSPLRVTLADRELACLTHRSGASQTMALGLTTNTRTIFSTCSRGYIHATNMEAQV